MYASEEARDADIDELAPGARPASSAPGCSAAATDFADAIAAVPEDAWSTTDRADARRADLPGRRPPSGCGCARSRSTTPTSAPATATRDWPPEFAALLLDAMAKRGRGRRAVPGRTPTDLDRTWAFGEGGPTVTGTGRRPRLVAHRPRRRRRTDQRQRRPAEDRRRGDAYTGDVTPGGAPDVRELPHLTITKVAVDPKMSNNCYLLRCRAPATRC